MSNTITIHGNASVQRDLAATSTGKSVFTFSVADTARKQVADGEYVDGETTWVEVPCWNHLAVHAAELVKNGQRVSVTGRLETERFTDRDGAERTKLVLHPDEVAINIRFGIKS